MDQNNRNSTALDGGVLKSLFENSSRKEELNDWYRETQLSRTLRIKRMQQGLTEKEVATLTGWEEDQVVLFEGLFDREICLGNLQQYLKAIGQTLRVRVNHNPQNLPEVPALVNQWIDATNALLEKLNVLAGEKEEYAHAAAQLLEECMKSIDAQKDSLIEEHKKRAYQAKTKLGELSPLAVPHVDEHVTDYELSPVP